MLLKKADIILIIILLFIALAFNFVFLNLMGGGGEVVVFYNLGEYARAPLNEEAVIEVKSSNGTVINEIVIEGGGVHMSGSSCKDKVCINQGHISGTGQVITCLPNKVVVEIVSGGKVEFDSIVR